MPRKNNPAKPSPAPAPNLPSPASGGGLGRGQDRGYPTTRCGYVALIGAPNAGKSTLLNQLVGRKLAIVTPKVQTTRTRLLGIAIIGATQLILVTPPASSSRAAASTAPWSRPPGPALPTPTGACCW